MRSGGLCQGIFYCRKRGDVVDQVTCFTLRTSTYDFNSRYLDFTGFHRWGCVMIGLLGVILVIRPGMGIVHWAVVLPLLSALFYSALLIITRVLGQREDALTTLFYTSIGGLILSSILILFFWKTPSPIQWLFLIWLGLLGAVGHFLMIKAFEKAPASLLAPFNYTSPALSR